MRGTLEAGLDALSAQATALLASFVPGVAGVAGSYAVAGFTPDFVAGPIAGLMARRMPGAVITFAITVLGDLGHQLTPVEVSTDGGDTWNEATLSDPLPGDDVWRQWVYRYDPPGGNHEVVVRAVDGTGERQTEEREDSYPSGATGWVSKTISP